MKTALKVQFTAIIQRSEKWFIALCPELDVASHGETVEEATHNITEAVKIFLQTASPSEITRRMNRETYITPLAISV